MALLSPQEKEVCDILIRAEWLDNVGAVEQEGILEPVLMFRTGGKHKLWLFSRLHRELMQGGLVSTEHFRTLLEMGAGLGKQEGWEAFPE